MCVCVYLLFDVSYTFTKFYYVPSCFEIHGHALMFSVILCMPLVFSSFSAFSSFFLYSVCRFLSFLECPLSPHVLSSWIECPLSCVMVMVVATICFILFHFLSFFSSYYSTAFFLSFYFFFFSIYSRRRLLLLLLLPFCLLYRFLPFLSLFFLLDTASHSSSFCWGAISVWLCRTLASVRLSSAIGPLSRGAIFCVCPTPSCRLALSLFGLSTCLVGHLPVAVYVLPPPLPAVPKGNSPKNTNFVDTVMSMHLMD